MRIIFTSKIRLCSITRPDFFRYGWSFVITAGIMNSLIEFWSQYCLWIPAGTRPWNIFWGSRIYHILCFGFLQHISIISNKTECMRAYDDSLYWLASNSLPQYHMRRPMLNDAQWNGIHPQSVEEIDSVDPKYNERLRWIRHSSKLRLCWVELGDIECWSDTCCTRKDALCYDIIFPRFWV